MIAVGGALGSMARYWVGSTISGRMGARFPYGTMVINMTACVILGFTLTYFGKRADLNPAWRFLVPIGFIGAYSTFSTYEWETLVDDAIGCFSVGGDLRGGEPHSGPCRHMVRHGAGRPALGPAYTTGPELQVAHKGASIVRCSPGSGSSARARRVNRGTRAERRENTC